MRLKSLEIQGFKTCPDKTKLSFEQGITAVVGPNGSGKSNISDAIRWVLGEQSPKSLRCSKMEDVVFNGTDKRKKLGYAEVSLNIENKDRVLAFDGDEVSITRRYYRSGESEYLINKAQVRLKDINELFMDTGLGRDGYSMIGQGKIDSIVSSKGEDRREIFEEAAGISRYRYRKTDAERKLKSTEENLLRLRDIVTELEERVGPLKRQSEKAQEFLKYSEEKRGLEIALWLLTLDKSQAALKTQDEKIAIAHAQYDDAEKMLEQIQKESEEIYLKNGQLAVKSDEVRHLISELDALISDMRSQLSVSKNDILHNEENIKRVENEIQNAQQNSQLISTQIAEKNEKIAELDTKIIEKQKEYTALSEKLNVINLDTGKSGDKLQQLTSELSMLTTKSADARVIDMTAESSISDLEERIESLTTANKDGIARVHELEEISEEYTTNLTNLREEITSITNSIQGLELKLQSKAHKRDSYKAESDRLLLDSKEHIRKINFLENLERNLEGFSKSVKVVVNASKSGRLKGVCGPVSRVISVPQKYGVAIETALGAAMQNIVTETENDAKSAIAYLKSSDGGRATFLPLNTIKARELRENGLEANYGFIGVASDLCSCDNKFKNILSSLLGKIVITDNLNSAVEIAKKYSYRFKIVTLDGQERTLDSEALLICDGEKAIGLAGIMGGENSMITDDVKTMLFEAACFDGTNIRLSAKKIGMRTEASGKFEKGLDPNLASEAIDRACQLIEELGAGEVVGGMIDVYPQKNVEKRIKFEPDKINKLLGIDISAEEMLGYLKKIELVYNEETNELIIPTFRQDLECGADIAEEVARFYGYANIPTTLPSGEATTGKLSFKMRIEGVARDIAEFCGFSQGMTYSFESPKVFDKLLLPEDSPLRKAIVISNPLGEDFSIMRTTSLNGMLTSLSTNYNRRNKNVKLYELGNIYLPKALPLTELPDERMQFTLGFYGDGDFFSMKGVVEEFLEKVGMRNKPEYNPDAGKTFLHPGRQADIVYDGEVIGYLGEVHPDVLDIYSIGEKAYIAVIDMPHIVEKATFDRKYEGIAKFPAVTRDISMVMDKSVLVGTVEDIIEKRGGKLVESYKLFDIYEGSQIKSGFKSVAYSISFRAKDRTLEDKDINPIMENILKDLGALGIELRS